MSDRITMSSIATNVMAANQNTITQLATYEQELSTGLKVNKPSDNPDAADQGMRYQDELTANTAYQSNISTGQTVMTDADNTLTQISTVMSQIQSDAVEGANGSQTPSSMQALGQTVNALLTQVVNLANSQSNGQYLFSGTATTTQPFVQSADGSTVSYQGNLGSYSVQIGPSSTLPVNQNGQSIFQSPNNVFSSIIQLRDALNSGDQATVSSLITPISQAGQQIDVALGSLGGNQQRLTLAQNQLQDSTTSLTNLLGQTIDADLPTTVTQMQEAEAQLQSGLEAAAKVIQPDLLSYLGN